MFIALVRVHPSRRDNFPTFWHIFLVHNSKTTYAKQSIKLDMSCGTKSKAVSGEKGSRSQDESRSGDMKIADLFG